MVDIKKSGEYVTIKKIHVLNIGRRVHTYIHTCRPATMLPLIRDGGSLTAWIPTFTDKPIQEKALHLSF